MRKRLFEIIEISKNNDFASQLYDTIMIFTIIISLIPLAFKSSNLAFQVIETITTLIFIIDYILRWFTADLKYETKNPMIFAVYPFTPMAVADLIVILSALPFVNNALKVMKAFRLIRTLRILRTIKFFRYSKSLIIIIEVLKKERKSLTAVASLAAAYILISALIIFNVEPDSFPDFFHAVYWATESLTTVGYGDIYPVTTIGRIVTMFSSMLGIAIIALPAGIITGGYLNEISFPLRREDLPLFAELSVHASCIPHVYHSGFSGK